MAFIPDLYVGYAVFKMGGRSFDVHAEIARGEPDKRITESFGAEPTLIEVGLPTWFGRYSLGDGEDQADFNESVALALIGGHDVELQLPGGEQVPVEINGDRFTGVGQWPLD